MASLSDSRHHTSDETEVTSQHCSPHTHNLDQGQYTDKDFSVGNPLVHQNSIYSLTLDEIQNTVCEPGRNFGSMNMDEFLTNIWNAEEGQALGQATNATASYAEGDATSNGDVVPTLQRQGSLTVPPPLSRKTVEEVWTAIHRAQGGPVTPRGTHQAVNGGGATVSGRQPTLGEMTLEDFLIKAGVVREPTVSVRVAPPQFGQMAMYPMGAEMGGGMYGGPMMGGANMNMNMNGEMMHGMMVGPVGSPGTPDGMGDDAAGYDRANGRKSGCKLEAGRLARPLFPVELIKRMRTVFKCSGCKLEAGRLARPLFPVELIKRCTKSNIFNSKAYTVELEAELTQLKEENAHLKEEEKKVWELKRQMLLKAILEQAYVHAQKAKESLRRSFTCTW
ncbi:protein ABSCISIC ACID-INSENSITIVE 5-like protein [Carex littledalei]|uniref:Protein ABSCISIC ACID-INSENSITIVE 5-like protein n=1 Tax=Carex littledalei TaxID=544730 RepID=A0A833VRD6_9POAL|nr:protein ABSCISIC ACID-INSENSITIVE 5-like protein [Carex littledalei]